MQLYRSYFTRKEVNSSLLWYRNCISIHNTSDVSFHENFWNIEILLVNVYSTRKYLVEVGNERSEEDEASEHTEEDEATEHTKEEDIKQNLEVGMDDGLQFRTESKYYY